MSTTLKSTFKRFIPALCVLTAAALLPMSAAHAQWKYGIGTGISAQKAKGTQGFTTLAGPAEFDVDLAPSDFQEMAKSALGFGGYATNGTWMVQYSLGYLELEDEASTPVGASTVTTKVNFKISGGEATLGYLIHKSPSVAVYLDGGVRYTKHELDSAITVTGAINAQRTRQFSHDWTDLVIGTTISVPLSQQWMWTTRLNAAGGGSDGTYLAQTGANYAINKNWTVGVVGKYMKVKFEDGNRGDSDWYLYDADESSVGLSVLYNF